MLCTRMRATRMMDMGGGAKLRGIGPKIPEAGQNIAMYCCLKKQTNKKSKHVACFVTP